MQHLTFMQRLVKEKTSEQDIWWSKNCIALSENSFSINRERAVDYLSTRETIYIVDGFAGWDLKYRKKIRLICSSPYHALFMQNMLIRPTAEELQSFGEPDYVMYVGITLNYNCQLQCGSIPSQQIDRRHDITNFGGTQCMWKCSRNFMYYSSKREKWSFWALAMQVKWKRVYLQLWTIWCPRKVCCHCIPVAMKASMVTFLYVFFVNLLTC